MYFFLLFWHSSFIWDRLNARKFQLVTKLHQNDANKRISAQDAPTSQEVDQLVCSSSTSSDIDDNERKNRIRNIVDRLDKKRKVEVLESILRKNLADGSWIRQEKKKQNQHFTAWSTENTSILNRPQQTADRTKFEGETKAASVVCLSDYCSTLSF